MKRVTSRYIKIFVFLLFVAFMIGRKVFEDLPRESVWHRYSPLLPNDGTMSDQEFADRVGAITDKVENLEQIIADPEEREIITDAWYDDIQVTCTMIDGMAVSNDPNFYCTASRELILVPDSDLGDFTSVFSVESKKGGDHAG